MDMDKVTCRACDGTGRNRYYVLGFDGPQEYTCPICKGFGIIVASAKISEADRMGLLLSKFHPIDIDRMISNDQSI